MRNFTNSIMSDMMLGNALDVGPSPHPIGSVLDVLWKSRERKSKEFACYGEAITDLQSSIDELRGMQELLQRQIAQHSKAIESQKHEVLA